MKPTQTAARADAPLAFFLDLAPPQDDFLADVIEGFSASPKFLLPKYFYDQTGSKIFDDICRTPEYYVTRTESDLLQRIGPELRTLTGDHAKVIEFGSGSSWKIKTVLQALDRPAQYVAIDISRDHLREAASAIAVEFPSVEVGAVCADFSQVIDLSEVSEVSNGRRLGFFPGSSIGNFTRIQAEAFLNRSRELIGPGGALLIGIDLIKDRAILERAYNDAAGHTAAFNRNVLFRMRRELDIPINPDDFEHAAFYNEELERIEMHLRALKPLVFSVDGRDFAFQAGETIHTENSHKYTLGGFQAMARRAGFEPERAWTDPEALFSMHYLSVP